MQGRWKGVGKNGIDYGDEDAVEGHRKKIPLTDEKKKKKNGNRRNLRALERILLAMNERKKVERIPLIKKRITRTNRGPEREIFLREYRNRKQREIAEQ